MIMKITILRLIVPQMLISKTTRRVIITISRMVNVPNESPDEITPVHRSESAPRKKEEECMKRCLEKMDDGQLISNKDSMKALTCRRVRSHRSQSSYYDDIC